MTSTETKNFTSSTLFVFCRYFFYVVLLIRCSKHKNSLYRYWSTIFNCRIWVLLYKMIVRWKNSKLFIHRKSIKLTSELETFINNKINNEVKSGIKQNIFLFIPNHRFWFFRLHVLLVYRIANARNCALTLYVLVFNFYSQITLFSLFTVPKLKY